MEVHILTVHTLMQVNSEFYNFCQNNKKSEFKVYCTLLLLFTVELRNVKFPSNNLNGCSVEVFYLQS